MKRKSLSILLVLVLSLSCLFAAGAGEAKRSDVIELEFMQWFAPELPGGAFEALIAEFEAQNPNIKVKITSIPNANYKDQVIAGIATGTLADVVALDEKYIVDIKDGLVPLDKYLNATSFKDDISVITKVGNDSKSVALVVFMYPLFVNMDLLKANGFNTPPQNRTEFAMMAKALTNPGKNQYGWVLPFPIISSTGLRVELMSLYWTNGYSMVKNGKPNLAGNQELIKTIEYVKDLYDTAISPGAFNKTEQDKLEEFATGRIAFMFNSLAAINKLNERAPNLNYTIIGVPTKDDYNGPGFIRNADWAVGISATSKHPDEAWKLIEFLVSKSGNQKLSSMANGLPGNKTSTPDWVHSTNPMFKVAFDLFQNSKLINEFLGIPNSDAMGEAFAAEVQKVLAGQISASEAVKNAQAKWEAMWQ